MDPFLTEALARLDRRLEETCAREAARAERLSAAGGGWANIRALAKIPTAELAFDDAPAEPLVPEGDHPLSRARAAFRLEAVETDTLLVLLALHVEPRYRAVYAVLQDDSRGYATERLVLALLGRSPARRHAVIEALSDTGRLAGSGLVVPDPGPHAPLLRPLDLAPDARGALLGLPLPVSIGGAPVDRLPADPAPPAEGAAVAVDPPPRAIVLFGAGEWRDAVRPLLPANGGFALGSIREPAELLQAGRAAIRLGALHEALPIVDLTGLAPGADVAAGAALVRAAGAYGGRIALRARDPLPVVARHIEAPRPSFADRRRAWSEEARRRGLPLDDDGAASLAAMFRLGPSGVAAAFDASIEPTEAGLREAASRLARAPVRHAVEVPAARTFDDLVVRDTTRHALARLVHFVQHRDRLGEERGLEARFQLRRGPVVLFSGLSGTGKTLAAEAVANALGRSLHVVDLARLVSKYIGETEKHIEEVLADAERADCVLFFDEADAIFSARTEVSTSNDRYANLEVGYLLQRVERHEGLLILATNLRHAIDEAFLRRFQFRVEFPFPDAAERHAIWERMIVPGVPRGADLDLAAIAGAHRLSGGEIRNAALKAIFLAERERAELGRAHLERAVALELLELGRLSGRAPREGAPPDRGSLLRAFGEAIERILRAHLQGRFLKEIHVVHGAPTKEALAGKKPAVSVALYRMAAPRGGGIRVGFVVSAWSHRAEEEHELLGAAHEALVSGSVSEIAGQAATMRVQESYDFDLLHRFWSSHGHPVRASVVVEGEISA